MFVLHFSKSPISSCVVLFLLVGDKCKQSKTSKLWLHTCFLLKVWYFGLDFCLPSATFSIRDIFIFSRSLPNVSQIAMCQPPDERWLLDSFQCSLVFLELLHVCCVSSAQHTAYTVCLKHCLKDQKALFCLHYAL